MANDPAPPILPSSADVVGTAKARLVDVRPSAAPHIETGRYARPFVGLRGQFLRARARLGEEARAARLTTSSGDALTELASSNFDTPRASSAPVAAIGTVQLDRRVVHWLPSTSLSVTAANATSEASLVALLTNVRAVFNEHAASVYSDGAGTGAHHVAETQTMAAPATATMGLLVATLNTYRGLLNDHLERAASLAQVGLGATPAPHRAEDTDHLVAVDEAFASDSGAAYSAQTAASQQSALLLGNALKAALNGHLALRSPAGTIRAGTRFRVDADPVAVPPIEAMEYVVTQHAYVRTGAPTAYARVRASVPGPSANVPVFYPNRGGVAPTAIDSLYDARETLRFRPTQLTAAGGTNGQPDALLRRAAAASWQGSYGPTEQAIVAGTLRFPGLARCPVLSDASTGASVLYPCDERWAQSSAWTEALEQYLRDEWTGVGCRIRTGAVLNRLVRVELSVVLRERRWLSDVSSITAALSVELTRYFDERPDFWIFRLAALRAVCSRAHPHIEKCVTATVRDADGVPLAEPAQPVVGGTFYHWWFAGGLEVTYDAPS